MASWVAQRVTPMITWEPNGVNFTDILNGTWDAYITQSALAVKAFPGTILLRPFHEFNGSYQTDGLANQGADATADANFIAAWQRIVTIFRQQQVSNVRWVWCYANLSVPSDTKNPWNSPVSAYPGDGYVDWVAFDAFNRGNQAMGLPWETFDQTISASYARATSISATRPVMISELGSNEYGDNGTLKATWFSTMFAELPAAYPHLRAISYFDTSDKGFLYALQSTEPAYEAWTRGLRSTNPSGVLNFRGNGLPLVTLTTW
jgi:beta-mannanase